MKRFLKAVFICCVVMTLLCSVMLVGRIFPVDNKLAPDLQRCGNTLCYLGIEPGKTTEHDAEQIAQNTPQIESHLGNTVAMLFSSQDKAILSTSSNDIISGIDFNSDQNFRLADIIAQFGFPCGLSPVLGSGYAVMLVYPNMKFELVMYQTDMVRLETPTSHIVISYGNKLCDANVLAIPYPGFTQYYKTYPNRDFYDSLWK